MARKKATVLFAGLRCPHCGDEDSLLVRVEAMVLECDCCGNEIDRDEVETMIAKWRRMFAWIDVAKDFDDALSVAVIDSETA